jgi:hypothetical protein
MGPANPKGASPRRGTLGLHDGASGRQGETGGKNMMGKNIFLPSIFIHSLWEPRMKKADDRMGT